MVAAEMDKLKIFLHSLTQTKKTVYYSVLR